MPTLNLRTGMLGERDWAKARNKELRKKTTDREVLRDSDDDEICNLCYSFNPPNVVDENYEWVACDSCALWYHTCCIKLE
jgi:hypothetical protein